MMLFGRDYTPPVFHLLDADPEQIEIMESVFDTLTESGIDFIEVRREVEEDNVDVITHGYFDDEEHKEIMEEIQAIYQTE